MSDSVILEQSLSDESSTAPDFVEKQILYVNDSNNSNYSSQIVIDTTSLSNSGSWLAWSESFLVIPVVLQMQSAGIPAADTATRSLDYAMAMKSGYWNLIHSMSVEFNNSSVVQQTPFLNVFSSFKALTSWSSEDVANHGKITGFCPDSCDAWLFNDAANESVNYSSSSGTGLCHNRTSKSITTVKGGVATITSLPQVQTVSSSSAGSVDCLENAGLLQRMKWLNFNAQAQLSSATYGTDNKMSLLGSTPVGLQEIFKSYVQASAGSRALVFPAVVRMKDICDFFDKMPLLKGSTMRLYINTNQCYSQLRALNAQQDATTGAISAGGNLSMRSPPVILGGGATCPFMVASAGIGQGLQGAVPPAVAQTAVFIDMSLSVVKTQFSQMTSVSAPITSVRLYCPAYTFAPEAEARYLAEQPTKKIVYEDIFQYRIPDVAGGGNFNVLVSNGLPNLKSLVVLGTLPSGSNGVSGVGDYVGVPTSSLLSPFCATGGAPDPVPLTQFQVQLSGKNIFNQNRQYDFESFIEQIGQSHQLNGNQTTGLTSGLIGAHEFEQLYRYYYVDCSRGLSSEQGVSRSIQIQGKSLSSKTTDLMVFAAYTRSVTLDLRSGSRLE
jgi:hypothetical protein